MIAWIRLVPPRGTLEIFGIRMVGLNAENARRLLLSIIYVALILLLGRLLRAIARRVPHTLKHQRISFWVRQVIRVSVTALLVLGFASIWFTDASRLATAVGLLTAGLAFALQRVVTALAAYLVILRGHTFTVGDRVVMGGVRGDVIALGLIQTTIMEMGGSPEPQLPQRAGPAAAPLRDWQYSGRIVTVTNDKIFDAPVFNYSRDFPYMWEEISVLLKYDANRDRAESILLEAATHHTTDVTRLSEPLLQEMERRYVMRRSEIHPRVYWRLTSNWLELSVRFLCPVAGTREVKDAMTRDILAGFDAAGIAIG